MARMLILLCRRMVAAVALKASRLVMLISQPGVPASAPSQLVRHHWVVRRRSECG